MAGCMGGRHKSSTGGGYEARFDPPLSEDFCCAICLMAFREPMQLQCGHQFCRTCLEHLTQFKEIQCPVDREPIDKTRIFPDKSMERKVLSLNVRCHYSQTLGEQCEYTVCEWNGELRSLEGHLEMCRYKTIKCPNAKCGLLIPEIHLQQHVTNDCEYREWSCEYCMERLLWRQQPDHVTNCRFGPVPCSNGCAEGSIARHLLDDHLKSCAYSVLTCDYFSYGCLFMGTKQERVSHEEQSVSTHLSMAVQRINNLEKQLQERSQRDLDMNARLELLEQQTNKNKKALESKLKAKDSEEKHLQEKIRLLQGKLREMSPPAERLDESCCSSNMGAVVMEKEVLRPYSIERGETTPIELAFKTMADKQYGVYVWAVESYRLKLGEAKVTNGSIYSEPFLSAKSGYKIRLAASLNGQHSGRGSHVGLRIQLMKGQHDSRLSWPFDHKITLMILHQEDEAKHVSLTFHPRDLLPDAKEKHFGRPTSDINPGRGKGGLLSHAIIDEDEGWTADDTIYFMCTLHS